MRLEIAQEAVIARTVFRATLQLSNETEAEMLANVGVIIDIREADGNPATDRFGIFPPELSGIDDIDGGGSVSPMSTATASWIIVPTREAAPTEPVPYDFGGTLTYTQDGRAVVVPLFPDRITVLPDPLLNFQYFLQRDVLSDDPHTLDIIEPTEPFSLGLMVSNAGAGTARNMRITSAQPKIVENDRGLLIDFRIIGIQVGLQEASPSLTVSFGDIIPGATAVARWLMTSTLQGHFIEYNARYEHVSALGDARLSLIDSLNIYELIHAVRATGPADDGLPDFLTNDVVWPNDPFEVEPRIGADPDRLDVPDTLHTSDGGVAPVTPIFDADTNGNSETLEAEITVTMPAGWAYIKVSDPFDGQYKLARVQRSDGQELLLDFNAWQTYRTFVGEGQPPIWHRRIHLFDQGGDGHYTLVFQQSLVPPGVVSFGTTTATTTRLAGLGAENEATTLYAIYEETTGLYVGPGGRLRPTAFWQGRDAWIGYLVRALLSSTEHRFKSQAMDYAGLSGFGPPATLMTSLQGDVDGNGLVTQNDLALVSAALGRRFGDAEFDPRTDLNGDDRVTYADLGLVRLHLGDFDRDGDVQLDDFAVFVGCMRGPVTPAATPSCVLGDFEADGDVNLADFAGMQRAF